MKPIYIFTLLFICTLLLVSCGQRNAKGDYEIPSTEIVEDTLIVEDKPIVKDSVDFLIEQRAEQEFNSTIFAGLRFGSNKKSVEKALRNKHIYKSVYLTEIPILVPMGYNVDSVIVRTYDAIYYNEQLASLVLYANEARLYNALGSLYSTKYGETKNNEWHYSNCEITIKKRSREMYHSPVEGWLANSPIMYYDTYRGESTTKLTKEPEFIVITYTNYHLLDMIDRQNHIKDSLEFEKRKKEIKAEMELANKLQTEPATNI